LHKTSPFLLFLSRIKSCFFNLNIMLDKKNLTPIGKITKPHGIHGEMSFSFTTDIFDNENLPFLIVELDGLLVPFSIKMYRLKSDASGFLQLEGIDTEDQAQEFSGLDIYLQTDIISKMEEVNYESEYFVGFNLIEQTKGMIGLVSDIDRSTANALFVVEQEDGKELLIPIAEDYILDIKQDKKEILLELPEGLLDL